MNDKEYFIGTLGLVSVSIMYVYLILPEFAQEWIKNGISTITDYFFY
jgi:hypothetical protein